MGSAQRLVAVLGAVVGLLLFEAGPARAHPTLLATSPEAGYAVAAPPEQVVLVFDEPVTPHFVRVLADGRDPAETAEAVSEQGGRRLVVGLAEDLAAGRYVVRWQVTAQDGDVVESAFDFAVGSDAAGLSGRAGERTTGLPLVVALRWLLFAALAVALGGLAGQVLVRLSGPQPRPEPRSLVIRASVVGALAGTGLLAQLAVTGGGRAAPLLGIEVAGFAAAAVFGERRRPATLASLGVVVAAEAWRNHLGVQDGAFGAAVVAVHLAAVALWVGALVHVLRTARAWGWRGRSVRRLATSYARAALAVFVIVVTTGTVGALMVVPSLPALVETGYGRTLLAKLVLVAVVTALAVFARRRLYRRGDAPLGRAARVESVTLVGVLAVTALLVSLPTPAPATQDLGVPLPGAGPVVRLGTLAGQVAVGLAASENQLELRLLVPDDAVQLGETPAPPY
ncbi:MAG: copper resistance CopC/CopD family protein, partial [Acidimicrobiales bacterium]